MSKSNMFILKTLWNHEIMIINIISAIKPSTAKDHGGTVKTRGRHKKSQCVPSHWGYQGNIVKNKTSHCEFIKKFKKGAFFPKY